MILLYRLQVDLDPNFSFCYWILYFRRQAHLCVLASNCDEPMYVKLVEALCAEHQINLIKVSYSLDFVFLKEELAYCKLGQLQTCVHLKAMHNDFCHTRESL